MITMNLWHAFLENLQRQIAEKWPHALLFSICVLCMGVMRWDSLAEQVEIHEVRITKIELDHDVLTRTAQEVHDIHAALGLRDHDR